LEQVDESAASVFHARVMRLAQRARC
jgi:hypothetical protein